MLLPIPTITNFGTVVQGRIYRGAQPESSQFAELASFGIKVVIDLREDFGREEEEAACQAVGLVHINIPIGFSPVSLGILPPTDSQLRHAILLMQGPLGSIVSVQATSRDNPGVPVVGVPAPPRMPVCFVHCEHGEDRTGAIVAGYRMVVDGWSNSHAMAEAVSFHINSLQVLIKEWIEHFDTKKFVL